MNVYETCPAFENEAFRLRPVEAGDCADLLEVYSDKNALPFFNSDNCHGDNFYYTTMERMAEAMKFWQYSYDNGWFVRWTIVDRAAGKAIGTVELCRRASEDAFNGAGILRIDVRSGYETAEALSSIGSLIVPETYELLGCGQVITKAPVYAVERVAALEKLGFAKAGAYLIGADGYAYDGYWTIACL